MDYPMASIVIPTYNRCEMLVAAVDSALKQDYPNLEIIVSDNCSNDDTENQMKKYAGQVKYYRQQENLGSIKNIEFVARNCSGKYFLLLCDDDCILDPYYIRDAVTLFEQNDTMNMVGSDCYYYYTENQTSRYADSGCGYRKCFRSEEFFKQYWTNNRMNGNKFFSLSSINLVIRKESFLNLDLSFDPKLFSLDCEFIFKLSLSGDVGYLAKPCIQYTVHGDNEACRLSLKDLKYSFRFINHVAAYMIKMGHGDPETKTWVKNTVFRLFYIITHHDTAGIAENYNSYTLYREIVENELDMDLLGDAFKQEMLFFYPNLFKRIFRDHKRIGIYGTGEHTEKMINMYHCVNGNSDGIEFVYFDSDKSKIGNDYLGSRIYNLQDISDLGITVIVISSFAFQNEIFEGIRYLLNDGFKIERIYEDYDTNVFTY